MYVLSQIQSNLYSKSIQIITNVVFNFSKCRIDCLLLIQYFILFLV